MRTTWGTPERRMFRTAVRSWNLRSGTPAEAQAFRQVNRNSLIGTPSRWKTLGQPSAFLCDYSSQ